MNLGLWFQQIRVESFDIEVRWYKIDDLIFLFENVGEFDPFLRLWSLGIEKAYFLGWNQEVSDKFVEILRTVIEGFVEYKLRSDIFLLEFWLEFRKVRNIIQFHLLSQ